MTTFENQHLIDRDMYLADPHPFFAHLRRNEPVYCDPAGTWALTKLEDVKLAERQPQLFSSGLRGSRPNGSAQPSMIDSDDPSHADQRRLVQRGFTPRQMVAYESHVREVARELVDHVIDRGECDLVTDIAKPMPMRLIGEFLGAPESDHAMLQGWSDAMIAGADDPRYLTEDVMNAAMEYYGYIAPVIAERKENPGDDLISKLLHPLDGDGSVMSDEMVIGNALLLLVGGNETTRNVITGGIHALLTNPDQLAHTMATLDDPATTVEECLRWVTPIQNMNRVTTTDVEIRGVTIPAGAQVLMCYNSANRDEDVFEDPFRFDVTRNPNPHIAFGWGPHLCLGAALARLQIKIVLTEVLTRLTNLRLADPDFVPEYSHSTFVRGMHTLPVRFG